MTQKKRNALSLCQKYETYQFLLCISFCGIILAFIWHLNHFSKWKYGRATEHIVHPPSPLPITCLARLCACTCLWQESFKHMPFVLRLLRRQSIHPFVCHNVKTAAMNWAEVQLDFMTYDMRLREYYHYRKNWCLVLYLKGTEILHMMIDYRCKYL